MKADEVVLLMGMCFFLGGGVTVLVGSVVLGGRGGVPPDHGRGVGHNFLDGVPFYMASAIFHLFC